LLALALRRWSVEYRYVYVSPFLSRKLQQRYCQLVEEHLSPASRLAAGLRALPRAAKAFASTQGAWRFYQHAGITVCGLAKPLLQVGRAAVVEDCDAFVLVVHDWSQLHYNGHPSKEDRVPLTQATDLGYELQTVLLVSDRDGSPLAPVSLSLRAADGVHCSRQRTLRKPLSPLDELLPAMEFVEEQRFRKPAVHIIDSEADSVGHYRQWAKRPGRYFLVRADKERVVQDNGQDRSLPQVRERLRAGGAFRNVREVLYHGRKAQQWIAEAPVVLTKAARPRRKGRKRRIIRGPVLPLRLVISEVRDQGGEVLAAWYLLTNVPESVPAATIALWYYWRWQVESYFKLMKSAGQELEHWQQKSASAVAKRLLVASMACVTVWQLMRDESAQAAESRQLLVRLSGRQMKRSQPFTAAALLAGMWVLLSLLYALEHYDLDYLRDTARVLFPDTQPRPPPLSRPR
jgi:hypothetical protein